jgi:hypothetical protein
MAQLWQEPESSLRRDLDTGFQRIVLYLLQAGLSPDQIKKEMYAAVERAVWLPPTDGEAARRADTKKTLDDYGKKVGS